MSSDSSDLIGFNDFKIPFLKIPPLKSLRNPFNEPINYREFESTSRTVVVLIHGLGGDSRYLTQLAVELSCRTQHHILAPDLKFHGEKNLGPSVKLEHHQDIILELDFLLENLKQKKQVTDVILIGHSLGGAIALKWLTEHQLSVFKKIVLLSPYLTEPYNVESAQFKNWIVRAEGSLKLQFPEKLKWGSEIDFYDETYISSCLPKQLDFKKALERCNDLSLIVSDGDQILDVNKYRQHFLTKNGPKLIEVSGLSHIGLVTSHKSASHLSQIIFPDSIPTKND